MWSTLLYVLALKTLKWKFLVEELQPMRKWFLDLTLRTKWITPCERAWKTVPQNVVASCVHFCLRSLVPWKMWSQDSKATCPSVFPDILRNGQDPVWQVGERNGREQRPPKLISNSYEIGHTWCLRLWLTPVIKYVIVFTTLDTWCSGFSFLAQDSLKLWTPLSFGLGIV